MNRELLLDVGLSIVGKTGSGKTVTSKGLVEMLLKANRRACIIDPTGVWWGLRAGADGDPEGGYSVVVIGGEHADVELNPDAGAALGEAVAGSRTPTIIDPSELRHGERVRFLGSFLEALYRHNRQSLNLVVDEADVVAPQKVQPEETTMLHRMDMIVRRGRVRGFIPWLLTQRPAVLNKDVLSQADALIAMKLVAPQDRKAILTWIESHATTDEGKQVMAALPRLERGTGYVWVPEHDILEQWAFPMCQTFDSSRTPKPGEKVVLPELSKVDVAELQAKLQVEAPPPAKGKAAAAAPTALELQQHYQQGHTDGEALGRKLEREHWINVLRGMRPVAVQVVEAIDHSLGAPTIHIHGNPTPETQEALMVMAGHAAAAMRAEEAAEGRERPEPTGDSRKRILEALAWWEDANIATPTRVQVALVAGYSVGGNYNRLIASMKDAGDILYPTGGVLQMAPGVRDQAGIPRRAAPTRAAFINLAAEVVRDESKRRVFRAIAARGFAGTARETIAKESGFSIGGNYNRLLSSLRGLGLIDYPNPGQLCLSNAFRGLK